MLNSLINKRKVMGDSIYAKVIVSEHCKYTLIAYTSNKDLT